MIGQYEHIPNRCRICGSSARLHTVYGLFWYECDNWKCQSNQHISPNAYTDPNTAFRAWNADNEQKEA